MGDGRLALFLPSLRGGGAERVMVTLARGFAERGHEVDLVLVRAEGPFLGDVPDAVRVIDLGAPRTVASLPALVRYLRRERPAAMLSALDHANFVALAARRLAGGPTRMVVSVRSTLSDLAGGRPFSRDRLLPLLAGHLYGWADHVVTVSRGVARDLSTIVRLEERRVHVIYNPIDATEVAARSREPVDHPWFGPGMHPVVLAVGRLAPEKDFQTLIRAFALLRRWRDARLVILGEGNQKSELKRLSQELGVAGEIDLPGFARNPVKYMARASVLALSSRREGLPNVLLEGLACGIPIVATDCPSGPREILEDGRWGTLVPVGDANAVAAAVDRNLGRGGRPFRRSAGVSRFSADAITDRYLRLLAPS